MPIIYNPGSAAGGGGGLGAGSGLSASGGNINLGGTLTGAAAIDLDGQTFVMVDDSGTGETTYLFTKQELLLNVQDTAAPEFQGTLQINPGQFSMSWVPPPGTLGSLALQMLNSGWLLTDTFKGVGLQYPLSYAPNSANPFQVIDKSIIPYLTGKGQIVNNTGGVTLPAAANTTAHNGGYIIFVYCTVVSVTGGSVQVILEYQDTNGNNINLSLGILTTVGDSNFAPVVIYIPASGGASVTANVTGTIEYTLGCSGVKMADTGV